MVTMKQTEIGLLPEHWEVKNLNQIGNFSKGKGISKTEANSGEIPAIRYGELYTKHHNVIRKFYSFINPKVADNSIRLKKGDILFAGSGETKEEIGKSVAFVNDEQAFVGGDIVILSPNKFCDPTFLGYLLNSKEVQQQKSANGQGDAVVHIYASSLKNIQIPLPPLPEQEAIAEALSDTDAWIESLEKLIAKKRLIKQGAMQELLSPNEDWEEYDFKDVVWYQEGPGLRNWQFTKDGIKVINVTNLENGYLTLSKTSRHISIAEFEKMYRHFEIDENDIVVASSGNSYGKVSVVRKQDLPLVMNTSVIRFKPSPKIGYKYLLIFLKSYLFKDQIDLLITGGAQPNFGPAHLNKIKIISPKSLTEQTRIATILSDMDTELEALETQLSKAKQIKQGMMQELLTGRIRLV
jgi:type I restriction enzyme S subunit